MRTTDLTRTGARNISAAPSLLDKARATAKETGLAVIWTTAHGASVAFPTDSATGDTWPCESVLDAQQWLTESGWKYVMLGMGGAA